MFLRAKNENVLCPICSSVRERPELKMPRMKALIYSSLAALLGGSAAFLFITPAPAVLTGLVSGVLSFLSIEVYYSFQFRRELECPVCHFDPLLYRRSPDKAKAQCLEELKRKEQLLSQRWQTMRHSGEPNRNRNRELHG